MTSVPSITGGGRAVGIATVAACAVGQAIAAGVAAFAMRELFYALHHGTDKLPMLALANIFGAGMIIAVLRIYARAAAERLGQAYAISLRRTLFRHLTRMPASLVAKRRNGALGLRFVGDLATARNWVGLGIARLVAAAIVIPSAAAVLVALNFELGVAAMTPLAITLLIMAALAPTIAPLHKRLRSRRASLAIHMMERVSVAPDLLLMGRDRIELEKLGRRGQALSEAAVDRVLGAAILRGLPEIGSLAAAACLLWVAYLGEATPAQAAGALAVLAILAQPMRDLAGVWDFYCAWRIARQKCETLFASPTLEPANTSRRSPADGPARINFKTVEKGTLRALNAAATAGTKIAIVGANGTGKSTCLALAAGLEQPERGVIEMDGLDLTAMRHQDRHRSIFYVGPRAPILRGSLRRALTMGVRPRPKDAAVERAAHAFGLDHILIRLGGLDGRISEGGQNLSTGEIARIHLVRAALVNPRLLLLDEPDVVLDLAGRKAFRNLVCDSAATTLFVSNDPELIACADVAWWFQDGVVTVCKPSEIADGCAISPPTANHGQMIS